MQTIWILTIMEDLKIRNIQLLQSYKRCTIKHRQRLGANYYWILENQSLILYFFIGYLQTWILLLLWYIYKNNNTVMKIKSNYSLRQEMQIGYDIINIQNMDK